MNAVEQLWRADAGTENSDAAIIAGLQHAMQRVLQMRRAAASYPALSWQADLPTRLKQVHAVPETGQPLQQVIDAALDRIEAGYCNVAHPLYLGYISPKPLMESVVGDFIAAALNQTSGAFRAGPAATRIEYETLHWLRNFLTLPSLPEGQIGGIFTSGGSMANLSALKLARDQAIGDCTASGLAAAVGAAGAAGAAARRLIYMSCEGHFSIIKAADMLGLGRESVRLIKTGPAGRIDLEALQHTILQDRRDGHLPLCIIGVAGTSASGAIDDLAALANLASEHGVWFHIDGAAGLAMAALPEARAMFAGMERADSIAFDPCKWMFTAFGLGCLFLKDSRHLRDSFDVIGHYWQDLEELEYFRLGFYGTRQWRSLGLWFCLCSLGAGGYRTLLGRLVENAAALRQALLGHGGFELLPNQNLPVVCFRPRASADLADARARELQQRINDSGQAYLTLLDWRGQTWLRAAFNNYSTGLADVQQLVQLLTAGD